jgi:hypothetical protein
MLQNIRSKLRRRTSGDFELPSTFAAPWEDGGAGREGTLGDPTGSRCGFTSSAQLFECQELERLHGKWNSLWDAAEATGLAVVLMARIDLILCWVSHNCAWES